MLAHGSAIGEVLGAVEDDDEGADFRTVDRHVGEDAGGVHSVGSAGGGDFGGHRGIGSRMSVSRPATGWVWRGGRSGGRHVWLFTLVVRLA